MIITVSPELLDLISKVEAMELEEVPKAQFVWSYDPSGRNATGLVLVSWIYKEFELYASDEGSISATSRDISKWDYDDIRLLPFDSDYEEEEAI